MCASFVAGRAHELERLSEDTFYLPHATSLRMGRLGYQSDAQSSLAVSYNNLESYAASLQEALTKPYPAYEAVGIRDGDDYRQLATSLLQIENEFYGTIRPKRVIRPGERPLHALRERGVEYVEVRLMDLDPFHAVGITAGTMRFLDMFLLHCLLRESPPDTPRGDRGHRAQPAARRRARARAGTCVCCASRGEVTLREWGGEILDRVRADRRRRSTPRTAAARIATRSPSAVAALDDPAATPSARVLEAMARDHGNSHVRFVLAQSLAHRSTILDLPLSRRNRRALCAPRRRVDDGAAARSKPPTRCRSNPIASSISRPFACTNERIARSRARATGPGRGTGRFAARASDLLAEARPRSDAAMSYTRTLRRPTPPTGWQRYSASTRGLPKADQRSQATGRCRETHASCCRGAGSWHSGTC